MGAEIVDVFKSVDIVVKEIRVPKAGGELPDCVKRAIECINTIEINETVFQKLLNALEQRSHELSPNDSNMVLMGIMDLAGGFTNTTSFREGELYLFDYGLGKKYLDERLL